MRKHTLDIDSTKKAELVEEFNEIPLVEEKLSFWTIRLKEKYFLHYRLPLNEIKEFLIYPEAGPESILFNSNLVESLRQYKSGFSHGCHFRYLDVEGLMDLFHNRMKSIINPNKKTLIKSHLLEIQQEYLVQSTKGEAPGAFKKAFDEFFTLSKDSDFSIGYLNPLEVLMMQYGRDLADFHLQLSKMLFDQSAIPPSLIEQSNAPLSDITDEQPIKDQFTINQKLLILHYLGIRETFRQSSKENEAVLLSAIFGQSGQRIRQKLSGEETLTNPKVTSLKKGLFRNLKKILPVFTLIDRRKIVKKINDDLQKLGLD